MRSGLGTRRGKQGVRRDTEYDHTAGRVASRRRPKPPSVLMFFRRLHEPFMGCQFDRSQNSRMSPFGATLWSTMSACLSRAREEVRRLRHLHPCRGQRRRAVCRGGHRCSDHCAAAARRIHVFDAQDHAGRAQRSGGGLRRYAESGCRTGAWWHRTPPRIGEAAAK